MGIILCIFATTEFKTANALLWRGSSANLIVIDEDYLDAHACDSKTCMYLFTAVVYDGRLFR